MIKNIIIGVLLVACAILGSAYFGSVGGTTNVDDLVVTSLTSTGNYSQTTTGTSTTFIKTSSATKGWCAEFHATSSNTLLNMTFAASSTDISTVGVSPIVRYGACN